MMKITFLKETGKAMDPTEMTRTGEKEMDFAANVGGIFVVAGKIVVIGKYIADVSVFTVIKYI